MDNKRNVKLLSVLAGALLVWSAATCALADDLIFLGGLDWNRPENWDANRVPTALDNAYIEGYGFQAFIIHDDTAQANRVVLGGSVYYGDIVQQGGDAFFAEVVMEAGDYYLQGGNLHAGTIKLNTNMAGFSMTGGSLSYDDLYQYGGLVSAGVANHGTLHYYAGFCGLQTDHYGSLQVHGNGLADTIVNNYGELGVHSGATLPVGTGEFEGLQNQNLITLAGGTIAGDMKNWGQIAGYGTLSCNQFDNYGRITQGQGNLTLQSSSGSSFNMGNIDLAAGRQLRTTQTLYNLGTLNLNGGLVVGELRNDVGGTISGPGTITGSFVNEWGVLRVEEGTLHVDSPEYGWGSSGLIQLTGPGANLIGSDMVNGGTIEGCGHLANNIDNDGTIEATGGTLVLSGSSVVNNTQGRMVAGADSRLMVSNYGLVANGGQIHLDGGTFDNGVHAMQNNGMISGHGAINAWLITNAGAMGFAGGTTEVFADITNNPGASIVVADTAGTVFYDDVINNGTITASGSDSSVVFFGDLSGSGSLNGGGKFFVEGDLRPGSSPGGMDVVGELILGGGAYLEMEIASQSLFDTLTVNGSLTMEGIMEVVALPSYQAQLGDTFELLTYDSYGGAFDQIILPSLAQGLTMEAQVGEQSLLLEVVASRMPGDVNGDLFVGGADLTKILDNWGMSPADWEDGDIAPFDAGDDFVGGADYTAVLDNWGNSYPPQPVPEPATLSLLLAGALLTGQLSSPRRRGSILFLVSWIPAFAGMTRNVS